MVDQFLSLMASPPALRNSVRYLCMWREAGLPFGIGSEGWYCIHLTVREEFRSAEWNNPSWHLSEANGLASQVTESVLCCKATNNLICHSWIDNCNVSDLCLCTARALKRDFFKEISFQGTISNRPSPTSMQRLKSRQWKSPCLQQKILPFVLEHSCISGTLFDPLILGLCPTFSYLVTARGDWSFPPTAAHQLSLPKSKMQAWDVHLALHSWWHRTIENCRNVFAKFAWNLMLMRSGSLEFLSPLTYFY